MQFRSDSSEKINIQVTIQIAFPVVPLPNTSAYFSEKQEEASVIIDALKRLEITDYQLRYCLVIDGEFDSATYARDVRSLYLVPGPPQWTDLGQFIMQITAQVSKDFPQIKNALDIGADVVNILAPLVAAVYSLTHREKKRRENIGVPTITVSKEKTASEEKWQVKIEGYKPKDAQELAKELAPLVSNEAGTANHRKYKIKANFPRPPQSQSRRKRRRRK